MENKVQNVPTKVETVNKIDKKPNELGSFHFMTAVKIFDPQTNQVFVQKRCD